MNKKLSRVIIAGIIGVAMMFMNQVAWAESADMVKIFKGMLSNSHQLGDSGKERYLNAFDETLTAGEKNDLIVDNKNWYIWFNAHKNIDVILSAAAWRLNNNEKLAVLCLEYFNTVGSSQEIIFFKVSNLSAPIFTMLPSNEILPELTESDFFNPGDEACFSIGDIGYRLPREGTSIKAYIMYPDEEDELLNAPCYARLKNIDHIELEWTGQKFIKGAEKLKAEKPKAEKPKQAAE